MECPVCHSTALSNDTKICPDCHADLNAVLLTYKIERTEKQRLYFGLVASGLLVILIVVWLVLGISGNGSGRAKTKDMTVEEFSDIKTKLENSKNENMKLKVENDKLTARISAMETEKAPRQEIYSVKPGESLFTIARKLLGNGYKYKDIAKDNNIENPDKLVVGQQLIIKY